MKQSKIAVITGRLRYGFILAGPNDELIFNCPPAEGALFIPCCENITYETVYMT